MLEHPAPIPTLLASSSNPLFYSKAPYIDDSCSSKLPYIDDRVSSKTPYIAKAKTGKAPYIGDALPPKRRTLKRSEEMVARS